MVILDHLITGLFLLLGILEGTASPRFNWNDDNPFVCKQQYGYFPDPKDCSAYYKCNFGNPIKEVCAPGLYYNEHIVTCDWPINVNCTQKDGYGVRYGGQTKNQSETTTNYNQITKVPQEFTSQTVTEVPPTTTDSTIVFTTPIPGSPAEQCQLSKCPLPYCWCDSPEIPGNLTIEEVPQMVILSFEDSVNEANILIYKQILKQSRTNPNNCPIKATFFVSHRWTDYSMVQELYYNGHEIASRSINNLDNPRFTSSNIDKEDWKNEIYGQKEILSKFGNINPDDILGMRAPAMQIGGNNQYEMLYEEGFLYDSSVSVTDPPIYPFTLDYAFSNCIIDPCPTNSYPGVWEIPLVIWFDLNSPPAPCVNAASCQYPNNSNGVYQLLKKNFERHYLSNRAPFNMVYGSAWFAVKHHKEGLEKFLTELKLKNDVFFVTMYQAIQWMKNPTPLSKITSFNPWNCKNNEKRPAPCKKPKHCQLWENGGVEMFKTCQDCPQTYPSVGNPYGEKINVTVT